MYLPNYILNISYRVEISKWSHMYILTFAVYWQILLVFPLCNVYSTKESQNLILFCRPNVLCMLVAPLCPNLWDLIDCSLPSSSVHGILQARILEWIAISFSRGCSHPRDRTRVSCLAGRSSTNWPTRESQIQVLSAINLKDKQKIFFFCFPSFYLICFLRVNFFSCDYYCHFPLVSCFSYIFLFFSWGVFPFYFWWFSYVHNEEVVFKFAHMFSSFNFSFNFIFQPTWTHFYHPKSIFYIRVLSGILYINFDKCLLWLCNCDGLPRWLSGNEFACQCKEMQETQVQSLGLEDHLEKKMATHSSILAWRILWTEEPGGCYSPQGYKQSDTTESLSMHTCTPLWYIQNIFIPLNICALHIHPSPPHNPWQP